jgi:hypothetical protein
VRQAHDPHPLAVHPVDQPVRVAPHLAVAMPVVAQATGFREFGKKL